MAAKKLTCKAAKQIDLVDFLSHLGHDPVRIRNHDYWYLSPIREEKTASFKVNRQANVWFDHGTGEGGNLIDFGIQYFRCPVSELLNRLSEMQLDNIFSFHQPYISQQSIPAGQKKKIELIAATPITSPALCRYLDDRKIPLDIAKKYCKEVYYSLYGKHYFAIGFLNNSGGYELRNEHFKGSISPKDVSLFTSENKEGVGIKKVTVFEGFFSFLSYLSLRQNAKYNLPVLQSHFLILNSLSFLKKSREVMEKYASIHLFLDLDKAGSKATVMALKWAEQFKDERSYYLGYKDFNDFLMNNKPVQKQHISRHITF